MDVLLRNMKLQLREYRAVPDRHTSKNDDISDRTYSVSAIHGVDAGLNEPVFHFQKLNVYFPVSVFVHVKTYFVPVINCTITKKVVLFINLFVSYRYLSGFNRMLKTLLNLRLYCYVLNNSG